MEIHFLGRLREYLYSAEARMSPLEPDVPLVPANATLESPPEAQEGYARVFDGSSWSQVEDHRGATVWRKADASPVVVDWLGPIGEEYTDQEPGEYPVWEEQAGEWTVDEAALAIALRAERCGRLKSNYDPAAAQLTRLIRAARDAEDSVTEAAMIARLSEWDAYAQALCELPAQAGFPTDVAWPEEPSMEGIVLYQDRRT